MESILGFAVRMVGRVRDYVVPSVEFENVICRLEVAGAELERVAAFEIVGWVMRAVRKRVCQKL